MSQGYFLGVSGRGGLGPADLGTLQNHAVSGPLTPGQPTAVALCHTSVRLLWLGGWAIGYSLTDWPLCEHCKTEAIRTGHQE